MSKNRPLQIFLWTLASLTLSSFPLTFRRHVQHAERGGARNHLLHYDGKTVNIPRKRAFSPQI